MKKIIVLAAALLVAGSCSDMSTPTGIDEQPTIAAAPPSSAIPNQYIVVFKNNVGDPRGLSDQLAAAHGASVRFKYTSAIKGFAASMSANAAEALSHNPNVLLVEEDQEVSAIATQTMDGAGDPWGLDRIDARSGLNASYTYALTGTGVHVYIIDTGIRTTHSEFGGRATGGMTSINDGNGTTDCDGHGTHVAGTVGGATYGVAKNVQLVSVRVLDCKGSGSWSGVIAGIDWVTSNAIKPAAANMSLGGGASSAVDLAVENSIASGVTYAVAAGNGNNGGIAQNACNYSPSRTPNALTIGATTKTDVKASWSNYGSCVDWFAPGVGIKSAWGLGDDNSVNTISGTSMATPHTTGVVALYLQANPAASPAAVRAALFDALTKGAVTSSNTTNNHLLYSPPAGFGGPPPANAAPTAAFTESCTNLACNFTDGSSDTDGSIASRSWNFGDGGTATATNPSHTFAAAGPYTVTLTVTDNNGAPATTFHTVTVSSPPVNQAPTAAFTESCTYLACTFTDGSSDNDGSIASRSWDFGDGSTSTATNPSHTFAAAGPYTVTLTVTDNNSAPATTFHTVTVSAPPVNIAPTAAFTETCTNLVCSFTDGSSDTDGSIASRSWNFGDGTTSTLTSPSHTYAAAGSYTVTLTVTDNNGAPATTFHSVTVTAPPPPPIALTITATKVKSDWTANLSWTGATGANVDVYRNNVLLKSVPNTGSTTDSGKGSSANTYRVCQTGTQVCSNSVTPQ